MTTEQQVQEIRAEMRKRRDASILFANHLRHMQWLAHITVIETLLEWLWESKLTAANSIHYDKLETGFDIQISALHDTILRHP